MIGSLSNLELLMHCHYSSSPHERLSAPAIQDGLAYLIKEGMIKQSVTTEPNVYNATPKGIAYLNYLIEVPFPEPYWIVPERK